MATCPVCSKTLSSSDSPIQAPDGTVVDTPQCRDVYTKRNIEGIHFDDASAGVACGVCSKNIPASDAPILTSDGLAQVCTADCLKVYDERKLEGLPNYGDGSSA